MSKYRTIDVWNEFYGRKESAYDYAGRLMKSQPAAILTVPNIQHSTT